MAIDERSRHVLFNRLQEILGEEQATVLMEHLPPVGWAEVATKRDLERLESQFSRDLDQLEIRFEAKLDAKIDASARDIMSRMTTTMILLNTAMAGVVFAAARLA